MSGLRGRLLSSGLTVGLLGLLGLLGALTPGLPGAPPAAAAPVAPCVNTRSDGLSAGRMAARCGRSVEDLSARTVSSQTTVRPDGSRMLVSYAQPRWVRRSDGSWTEVDTALRRAGGGVMPGATVLPLTFSAGGDAPLAKLADAAGRAVSVSWPGPLPAPVLSGDSATYPEVLPGVDLRMTASATGFAEVLVVKTRQAAKHPALARIRLGMATAGGLTVKPAADGGLEAVDPAGRVAFEAPAPTMWDSSTDGVAGPGFPRTTVMPVQVGTGEIVLTPDRAMFDDPATRYPVYVDPSWTGHISGGVWKVVANRSDLVNSSTFVMNNGAQNGNAGAGRTCDNSSGGTCTSVQYLVRTMFRMETFGAAGKHVLRATFNITQKWSWTCSPASNARLWLTGGISTGTTWNNQPGWDGGHIADAPGNHRRDGAGGCAGTGNVAFNATGMVQYGFSQGWPDLTLGLRAVDEGTVNNWKRFDAGTAALSIEYNTVPSTPDTLNTHGQGCATGSGRPVLAVANPTLAARVTDPDGAGEGDINGVLRGEFGWEQWNASTSAWSPLGSGTGVPQAGGTTSPAPAPSFASGGIYRWHARASDSWSLSGVGSGTDFSGWSGWCEFEVDTVVPNPALLTPDAANAPFVAGKTVRLGLAPGGSPADTDITGYTWWVVDGAGTHAAVDVTGSTATVNWSPIVGQGTIVVQARDRARSVGPTASYAFNAAQLATEAARWPLDDPAGAVTAADGTDGGHDATAALTAPATLGAPGRIVNGATALSLNGVAGNQLATAGPVLDTTKNLTVTAWIRLDSTTVNRAVVSQDGAHMSGFKIQYTGSTCTCWDFVMIQNDATDSVGAHATAPGPARFNVWTHLAAVYDRSANTVKLYINGALAGSGAGPSAPWNATGPLRIGASKWNDNIVDFFPGGIADVRVWNRALPAGEIAAIVDPTDAANVGTAMVGQWLVEPESCLGDPATTCQDSTAYAHDVNLSGGVSTTTAGQSGSGLQYDGTDGIAQTVDPNTGNLGPVLHTDQSFTVSAWMKLADLPTGAKTGLGQSGSYISGFFLGYRVFSDGSPRWSFSMKDIDSDNGPWVNASSSPVTTADVGRWTHLVGVYDATTGAMSLYINGALAGSATRTAAPWDATGPLTIGAALWSPIGGTARLTDYWNGTIDTVSAYAGAVPPGSINRIP
jgi:Concanavalin A-like lectin/glucanases superfamily